MHCPLDLLAWHNDQWLAMSVHDAKLYSGRQQHRTAVGHGLSISRGAFPEGHFERGISKGAFGQVAPALDATHP
jgi:hypothetical protein